MAGQLAPRRYQKAHINRRVIAQLLDIPDDVRIERLIATDDSEGIAVVLSSERFDEVPEEWEIPFTHQVYGETVEHEGKTYVRYEVRV